MSNLINYLSYPIKKLFNTPEFKAVVKKHAKPTSPVTYPYMFYPEAGLTNEGAKFKYADGVELISYHIKGITPVSGASNGFQQYLCSVRFSQSQGGPFILPGSLTGMFQSGGIGSIVTSPLAVGGLVELDGVHVPISELSVNLYDYGNNPQEDGTYVYALVLNAVLDNPETLNIEGLVSYDFEFLLSNSDPAPTIFQD